MLKAKVFTANTPEGLEKDINVFLRELTNVTVLQTAYQHYPKDESVHFTALILYRIEHDTTQFGSA